MAIPSVNELMGPVLEILGDAQLHSREEIIDKIATKFGLTPADIEETVADTTNSKIGNQIDWVCPRPIKLSQAE
ncbi:MAG TPA: winged helix-turn-helix domain-containing protein [Spirillospora sp.]|nr:winged helix-turn-helix domain-containing protein [Spirillospora sp.]